MKEGWEKYSLMDICNVTTGKHDANHAEMNGKYRFYTCSSQYVYCNTKRYEGECIILPGNGINVGESYYYNGEFDAYQRTYVIDKIDKRIIPMYLFYHLQNNWKSEGVAKQYGSATNYIKIGNFKDYIVKMPQSLSEQQSIVDYLDSAFAKIDAMKANAEKALNEAKALFQASLKEMLEPKKGWVEKRVGEIAEIKGGKRLPKGEKLLSEHTSHKYIRVADFNEHGSVDLDDIQYISDKVYEQIKRYIINKEDIYISIAGTIGKSGIIPKELDGANLTENACRLILSNEINQRYMYYVTISPVFIRQEIESTKISAQPKLALTRLADIMISYPSITEQQKIADTLDSLKSKVDRLQENYDKISQECDALKQAILRQVFE